MPVQGKLPSDDAVFMRYIIPRISSDERTFAVVEAKVREDLIGEREFLAAIKSAVTSWVKTSEVGREAWSGSSQDFNVGDLSLELESDYEDTDEDLRNCLEAAGIYQLSVDCLSDAARQGDWTYDTVLVNELELDNVGEPKQSSEA